MYTRKSRFSVFIWIQLVLLFIFIFRFSLPTYDDITTELQQERVPREELQELIERALTLEKDLANERRLSSQTHSLLENMELYQAKNT